MNKYIFSILGYIIISFGAYMTIATKEIGLEPWSATMVALSERAFTYGFWTIFFHVIFISATWLIEKKPPRIGTFINMIMIGPLVDLFLFIDFLPPLETTFSKYLIFILGVVVSSIGASLVIATNLGAGSKTQFYVTIHNVTKLKISYCKNMMEALGVLLALIFGGPPFIGTILFIVISSYAVEFFVTYFKKRLVF